MCRVILETETRYTLLESESEENDVVRDKVEWLRGSVMGLLLDTVTQARCTFIQ